MAIILIVMMIPNTLNAKSKNKNKTAENIPAASTVPKIKIESDKPKNWCPELKIGLYTLNSPFNLSTNLDFSIIDSTKNKTLKNYKKNTELIFSAQNNFVKIDGENFSSNEIELRPQNEKELRNMLINIGGQEYFGGLKLIAVKNNLIVINIVPVEEYLRGVLPKEMSPSWNEEALKAQAVAARTFSLKNRNRHKNEGYDLCASVHCQMYDGADSLDEKTDEAISKTFGEVLFFNGKLIEAPFHRDSGGITENAVDVWGTDFPYLRAVTEIETKTMAWEKYFSFEEFTKILNESGHKIGDVKFIKVTNLELGKVTNDRSSSGRVKELTIVGSSDEIKLSGSELRKIFGLKSTLFDVSISGNHLKFIGYGWGHGVGMSQHGAQTLAENKYSYEKILAHYYKGTEIKRLY